MHTNRCRFAKSEKKKCRCACEGVLHGMKDSKDSGPLGSGEILLSEEMGGEIEEFLKDNLGKEYFCWGPHKRKKDNVHVADQFWGIKSESGLRDKAGQNYWVIAICSDPKIKSSPHQTSYIHFSAEVDRAIREREYISDFGME